MPQTFRYSTEFHFRFTILCRSRAMDARRCLVNQLRSAMRPEVVLELFQGPASGLRAELEDEVDRPAIDQCEKAEGPFIAQRRHQLREGKRDPRIDRP